LRSVDPRDWGLDAGNVRTDMLMVFEEVYYLEWPPKPVLRECSLHAGRDRGVCSCSDSDSEGSIMRKRNARM
jgi:hypothetical protein